MKFVTLFSVVGILAAIGCATGPLPAHAQRVGGGLAIEWTAPRNGTVILYDSAHQRMVTSRSLEQGGTFLFPNNDTDSGILDEFYGAEEQMKEARFELYFVPAGR